MNIELRNVVRSRAWQAVLAVFAMLNAATWIRYLYFPPAREQLASIGFPVPFYISGGIEGVARFTAIGLLLDVAIAVTLALLVAGFAEWRKS